MRISIVDDDACFAKSFSEIIRKKWNSAPELLDIFPSAQSFLTKHKNYDVIFLDIEMPGLTGIEMARNYHEQDTIIIFVTNREDLVFEAYNTTNATGFIRKSHLEEDLKSVIDRITNNHQQEQFVTIKNENTIKKLRYSDIIYVEKVAQNAVFHTESDSYTIRKSLTEAEQELMPYGFVRSHAGYLINLTYVEFITSSNAVLKSGASIPISRNKLKLVKDVFLERNVLLNE